MRGKLVTFEGIDGCGKSSVSREVARLLRREKVDCAWTCEPTRTWLGQAVRRGWREEACAYTDAFLFMADRAEHVREIRSLIERGKLVVSDRYMDSTLAYQGAALEDEHGAKGQDHLEWLRTAHEPFALVPDLTLLLKAPPGVCLSRLSRRKGLTKFERLRFLKKVARNYDILAGLEPERFVIMDASLPLREVVEASLAAVKRLL